MLYNSPVLYDRSAAIVGKFSNLKEKKKYLFIHDQTAANDMERLIDKPEAGYESFSMNEGAVLEELNEVLNRQKMGTQLYIAAGWDNACLIFNAAIEAGFIEDEIQVVISGLKRRSVYCMKCFHLTETKDEKVIHCSHCGAKLEIGSFYSKVHKGYIGYPI